MDFLRSLTRRRLALILSQIGLILSIITSSMFLYKEFTSPRPDLRIEWTPLFSKGNNTYALCIYLINKGDADTRRTELEFYTPSASLENLTVISQMPLEYTMDLQSDRVTLDRIPYKSTVIILIELKMLHPVPIPPHLVVRMNGESVFDAWLV